MQTSIRLCVPFVNDDYYINSLKSLSPVKNRSIYEVYGSLPQDPVGNLRPPGSLFRQMDMDGLRQNIRSLHECGIKFDYVMNSELLPIPLSKEYINKILSFLGELSDIGIDEITVTVPLLMSLIHRNFPHIKVNASICNETASVKEALEFEELGASVIVLDRDINRDFPLLREIRRQSSCDIKVLCNSACVYHCIHVHYHGIYSSALSSAAFTHDPALPHVDRRSSAGNPCSPDAPLTDVPYCNYYCRRRFFNDPSELIKIHWIRPEDLELYAGAGINLFKIDGRDKSPDYLLEVIGAYLRSSYEGNFLHLLQPEFCKDIPALSTLPSAGQADDGQTLDERTRVFLVETGIWKAAIPNRDLDDFTKAFSTEKVVCRGNCHQCGYCDKYAEKVVIDPEWQKNIVAVMDYNLERYFAAP